MRPYHASNCFLLFDREVSEEELPKQFTFPFYYQPHALCKEAVAILQQYLVTQTDWQHNFGLDTHADGLVIGKMFGVLLAQDQNGRIGFLAAFSGKLAGKNNHPYFVPPIFDMLNETGFFIKGEHELNAINARILTLENNAQYNQTITALHETEMAYQTALKDYRTVMKQNKAKRSEQRQIQKAVLDDTDYELLCKELIKQSYHDQHEEKLLQQKWKEKIVALTQITEQYQSEITQLKELRKAQSAQLQQRLFDQYNFLNIAGETKNVLEIFDPSVMSSPPSGAGECATPKLLQYAFQHKLKPLAMAEFWWGQSPVSEIRKHKQYYPACRGKCEPILAHMLRGISMDENPMLHQEDLGANIKTVYEDEHIVVVNKPAEFLSVPGKNITESVYSIMKTRYPHATGPLLVHRLDMSTSGLLLVAKTKEAHQNLQSQFIKKTITKRYIALLDGVLNPKEGLIDLPLRVDLDNRPHQLVCYEYGKPAQTRWEVIGIEGNRTRVHFYPITGRTHQLRVHAAHKLGLHTPIVGDDLYGTKANRLHLHAEYLLVKHPVTRKEIAFSCAPDF